MKTPRSMVSPFLVIPAVLIWTSACGSEPAPRVEPEPEPTVITEPELAWLLIDAGTTASFRGLSALSEDLAWVSGTGGTWARTEDGGSTWQVGIVPDAEELDFRDVDAFDANTAYLMGAGPGEASRIYKTVDGGATWQLQFTNPWAEGFFDGMAFWDSERGLAYGDPVEGRFTVMSMQDGGATWTRVPDAGMPPALDGEAGFAASGSGLAVLDGGFAWFGTGGPEARVFRSDDYGQTWTVASTPMAGGEGSRGIFSLAFRDAEHGVAVGGDYTQPEVTTGNAARTVDGGLTWTSVDVDGPAGYRSGVAYDLSSDSPTLIAVGTSGSDLSTDDGVTWKPLSDHNLNAVRFGSSTHAGWAVGPEGRIVRLGFEAPD